MSERNRWPRVEQGSGATVEIKGTGSEWIGRQRWSKISPLGEWEDNGAMRSYGENIGGNRSLKEETMSPRLDTLSLRCQWHM